MRQLFLPLAGIMLGLASPTLANAQAADSLVPGHRVWVRTDRGDGRLDRGVKGTLVAVTRDTLILRTSAKEPPLHLALAPNSALFVSTGTKSRALRGALIGAGIGTVAGILLGAVAASEDDGFGYASGTLVGGGALTVGLTGATIGLVAGALSRSDIWQPVDRSGRAQPIGGVGASGVRLGLQIGF